MPKWLAPMAGPEPPGATGIWFLKTGESGTWKILPVVNGQDEPLDQVFIKVPVESPSGVSQSAPLEDKLALEIAAALQNPGTAQHIGIMIRGGSFDDLKSDLLSGSAVAPR